VTYKRKPHESLIEEAIRAKGPEFAASSAQTLRTDALAILESFVAEVSEETVMNALSNQGFRSSGSYLTSLRALAEVARSRRPTNDALE
jgi:hypothetical protein